MKHYPDKNAAFPNPIIPSLCYIKNVVKSPRMDVGDVINDEEGMANMRNLGENMGFILKKFRL